MTHTLFFNSAHIDLTTPRSEKDWVIFMRSMYRKKIRSINQFFTCGRSLPTLTYPKPRVCLGSQMVKFQWINLIFCDQIEFTKWTQSFIDLWVIWSIFALLKKKEIVYYKNILFFNSAHMDLTTPRSEKDRVIFIRSM
jgi:hypothetical protein